MPEYQDLAGKIAACTACFFRHPEIAPLAALHAVLPVKVLFVGENPSWQEGQAAPFDQTTISGQSLDDNYLQPLGLDRAQVWIGDLFKCRYPRDVYHQKAKNETRIQREVVRACKEWLLAEIAYATPKILVTLSDSQVYQRFRRAFSLSTPSRFATAAGTPHSIHLAGREVILFPMVHPDVARPPNGGDGRKLRAREKWAPIHAHEHIPALAALLRAH